MRTPPLRLSMARQSTARLALALLVSFAPLAHAEVRLIAHAKVPGTATDLSGLAGTLENGVPANRLGGFGSAIAWTGEGDRFLALSDRGPNAKPWNAGVDHTTSYAPRFHAFRFTLSPAPEGAALPFTLSPSLLSTTLFSSREALAFGAAPRPAGAVASFTGRADAFGPGHDSRWAGHARLDPEALRVAPRGGSLYVGDEYGPALYRFDGAGRRLRNYSLPAYYGVAQPGPVGRAESSASSRGRVANRSLEGLALTPDGRTLVGAMQSPLIQDGGVGALRARIISVDVRSGRQHEFVYALAGADNMVSEILALNERDFLVVERDGTEGTRAAFKRIVFMTLDGATDVAGKAALPAVVTPVAKSPFIDLLDARFGLRGADFPQRIEGLSLGPDVDIAGVRHHTLYVSTDNDYLDDEPTHLFVFAIGPDDLKIRREQSHRHATTATSAYNRNR